MHDVAVAGGSVAGAAVAIQLARSGRSVVLLERARGAVRKACGEGLFPVGVEALERLGITAAELGAQPIDSVRFSAGGRSVETRVSPRGRVALGIRRDRLAERLLACARGAGVEVRLGTVVRGLAIGEAQVRAFETADGPVPARLFVAADGLQSRLRRLAGLESRARGDRYGFSAHVRLATPPAPRVDVLFARGFEVYVTPVGASEANVAVLARRHAMRGFGGDLGGALVRHGAALLGEISLSDRPLAAGPFARRCSRPWRGNLVLVGDAAGFLDGISGEGMSAALVGAERAAMAIARVLDGAKPRASFARYARELAAVVRDSNLMARLALLISCDPRLARFAIANLQRRPETFARLVAVNAGELGLGSLRPRDVLGLALGI